ncbi:hypothetical protein HDU93_006857 [Gonapodya sp. JEL0774]|nr:hypothetical protein HDU93_006857 [Gonapodya sp. JEL0774]
MPDDHDDHAVAAPAPSIDPPASDTETSPDRAQPSPAPSPSPVPPFTLLIRTLDQPDQPIHLLGESPRLSDLRAAIERSPLGISGDAQRLIFRGRVVEARAGQAEGGDHERDSEADADPTLISFGITSGSAVHCVRRLPGVGVRDRDSPGRNGNASPASPAAPLHRPGTGTAGTGNGNGNGLPQGLPAVSVTEGVLPGGHGYRVVQIAAGQVGGVAGGDVGHLVQGIIGGLNHAVQGNQPVSSAATPGGHPAALQGFPPGFMASSAAGASVVSAFPGPTVTSSAHDLDLRLTRVWVHAHNARRFLELDSELEITPAHLHLEPALHVLDSTRRLVRALGTTDVARVARVMEDLGRVTEEAGRAIAGAGRAASAAASGNECGVLPTSAVHLQRRANTVAVNLLYRLALAHNLLFPAVSQVLLAGEPPVGTSVVGPGASEAQQRQVRQLVQNAIRDEAAAVEEQTGQAGLGATVTASSNAQAGIPEQSAGMGTVPPLRSGVVVDHSAAVPWQSLLEAHTLSHLNAINGELHPAETAASESPLPQTTDAPSQQQSGPGSAPANVPLAQSAPPNLIAGLAQSFAPLLQGLQVDVSVASPVTGQTPSANPFGIPFGVGPGSDAVAGIAQGLAPLLQGLQGMQGMTSTSGSGAQLPPSVTSQPQSTTDSIPRTGGSQSIQGSTSGAIGSQSFATGVAQGLGPLFQSLQGMFGSSGAPGAGPQAPQQRPAGLPLQHRTAGPDMPAGIVPDPSGIPAGISANVGSTSMAQSARRQGAGAQSSSTQNQAWDMGRLGPVFASMCHLLGRRRAENASLSLREALPPLPVSEPNSLVHLLNLLAPVVTLKQLRRLSEGHASPFKDLLPVLVAWVRRDCLNGTDVTERNVDSVAENISREVLVWMEANEMLALVEAPENLIFTLGEVTRDFIRRLLFMILAVRPGGAGEFAPAFARDIVLWCKDLVSTVRAKILSACEGNKVRAYSVSAALVDTPARKLFEYFRRVVAQQSTEDVFVGEAVAVMFGAAPDNLGADHATRTALSAERVAATATPVSIADESSAETESMVPVAPVPGIWTEDLFASLLGDSIDQALRGSLPDGSSTRNDVVRRALDAGLGRQFVALHTLDPTAARRLDTTSNEETDS